MLSKNNVKLIKSLQIKKYRIKENLFMVEGAKSVLETLQSDLKIHKLFITERFYDQYNNQLNTDIVCELVTEEELTAISDVQTNQEALAVVEIPNKTAALNVVADELILALDDIRDPGNLGSIIRIADWYGIRRIIASETTADFYNPKTIRASMGSFLRIDFRYLDLNSFFQSRTGLTVYGALLEGTNIHEMNDIHKPACILIGNESHGISETLKSEINQVITIPQFGQAESLNAAMATAIICDNFKRLSKK